ncbi:adenosylcobinamide-GDP ribazoletransferase [Sphingobium sp. HBC34]|uniref:Adenosylcobinamide-GDP ribazoletransferase n=1 Tax=Sphingobium cyanobacteriorum TaxID=3063954 RepID=A0ABT8ZQ52_9SPHN|nr:adenosylcobinamide-GDP ribazoletransferase [Sphingobium sp. HBC34]MDO7836674.1 adenosylcobinamide-GDP ribazoletransferase [Sphingobium sp. HBC34]
MKGVWIALQFLTRLPTPRVETDAASFARSMRCFPVAGLVIGALVAGAGRAGAHVDPWIAALAALVLWIGVTGALHLDGLCDLADARGAAHGDRQRFLTVLADPHAGSFGVVAIGLQLIVKLVLLHGLADRAFWFPLMLIPFAARIGPLVWTSWLPPLHAGLAAGFRDAIGWRHVSFWLCLLLLLAPWAPALLAAPLLIGLWGLWLHRHIGGVSGDCHGAGIELVESGLLVAALLLSR